MNPKTEAALARFARSRNGQPFQWGLCDCNTIALEALDLLMGTQIAFEVFGQYSTPSEANVFYSTYRRSWIGIDGMGTEIKPPFASSGDFLVASDGPFHVPHVVIGPHALTCAPETGVFLCRVHHVIQAHPDLRCFRLTMPEGA